MVFCKQSEKRNIFYFYKILVLERLYPILSINSSKRAPVIVGISIILLAIIDLLVTRQLLTYNNISQNLMFILTVLVGYGLASWILLEYAHRVSKEIIDRSRFWQLIQTANQQHYLILQYLKTYGNK